MGVFLDVPDFDHDIRVRAGADPKFLNDVPKSAENPIMSQQVGDTLSTIPQCDCKETKGEYLVGITCRVCGTKVKPVIEDKLESEYWIRTPVGVPTLINPHVMTMMCSMFGFDTMEYLLNKEWTPQSSSQKQGGMFRKITTVTRPEQRNLTYFQNNFDAIIEELINIKNVKSSTGEKSSRSRSAETPDFAKKLGLDLMYYKKYRDRIFCQHIPVINKALFVLEKNPLGSYMEKTTMQGSSVYSTFVGIDHMVDAESMDVRTRNIRERKTVQAMLALSNYILEMWGNTIGRKPGLFRKHGFGTRCHWSIRAVISSLTDQHRYDEIHIPWELGVAVFELHLINKMNRDGRHPNEIRTRIIKAYNTYDPYIDHLLKEIIAEAGPRGVPALTGRHPSLKIGSTQLLYITRVKTDLRDPTVSASIKIVRPFNADFDGKKIISTDMLW